MGYQPDLLAYSRSDAFRGHRVCDPLPRLVEHRLKGTAVKNLDNKVVAITGAGAGIGRALAEQLADRGARLALSDVDQDAAEQTAAACRARGIDARGYRLDVSDRDAVLTHADD